LHNKLTTDFLYMKRKLLNIHRLGESFITNYFFKKYIEELLQIMTWFKLDVTRRNFVHPNHIVTIVDVTSVQIRNFTIIIKLILCVILVINVCSRICNYSSHICNYSVDITKWSCKCNHNMWLLHVWMEKKMKMHFFIQY
jgi:hypothetical protein